MAPTATVNMDFANSKQLSNKEKHKLRKPAVEKMRRDRINNSIEQLKAMLEKEFHKQDPNAKLEKADILEMTVLFLKQQLLQCHSQAGGGRGPQQQQQQAHSDGYSQCWRETLHFLSLSSKVDASVLHLSQQASSGGRGVSASTPSSLLPKDLHLSPVSLKQSQAPLKPGAVTQKPVWRPW
ncbi:transcription factor HES-5-like [Engraulis encrasicolus]|uniref:transcription factor HES-5-like n=1 Tax=Engraulis encrasicolus TaxID=184585 RepID=UPI002FD39A8B